MWRFFNNYFFVIHSITMHRVGTTGKNDDRCMTWPLENTSVSHRLTFTSLSVRSGGPRLTLAGWWATHISATVRFYTATQPFSTRYGVCVCKNVRMYNECECFTAFDLWTALANTQLSAVVVCRILTLMLNWGLLSPYCKILQAVTVISLGEWMQGRTTL